MDPAGWPAYDVRQKGLKVCRHLSSLIIYGYEYFVEAKFLSSRELVHQISDHLGNNFFSKESGNKVWI